MPIFTPLYSTGREIRRAREQQFNPRKRRRTSDTSSNESSSDENNAATSRSAPASTVSPSRNKTAERSTRAEARTSTLYPVNRKDPYHIAGHAREEPLPPPPFPHKAAKPLSRPLRPPIEQTLAELKPPLYILPNTGTGSSNPNEAADPYQYSASATSTSDRQQHKTASLARRHADNLTTILHLSLQRGDWARAERAWKLLLRTTVSGMGIDVRREGLWGIGGEILMRRTGATANASTPNVGGNEDDDEKENDLDLDDDDDDDDENEDSDQRPSLTNEGFSATKSFYERLILQYPYTSHSQHRFNATAVYPAFFSVWLYQICHASRVSRRELRKRRRRRRHEQENHPQITSTTSMNDFYEGAALWAGMDEDEEKAIIQRELDGAVEIAARIDELAQTPPYDSDADLMLLRAMIQLWMADLTESLGRRPAARGALSARNGDGIEEEEEFEDDDDDRGFDLEKEAERQRLREDAAESRKKADEMIGKLVEMGVPLPEGMQDARKKTWTSVVV